MSCKDFQTDKRGRTGDHAMSKEELKLINSYGVASLCQVLALMLKQQKYIGGFIPLSNRLHSEAKSMNKCITDKRLSMDPIWLHFLVKKYDLPTFLGVRFPVNFDLNPDLLDFLLKDY